MRDSTDVAKVGLVRFGVPILNSVEKFINAIPLSKSNLKFKLSMPLSMQKLCKNKVDFNHRDLTIGIPGAEPSTYHFKKTNKKLSIHEEVQIEN